MSFNARSKECKPAPLAACPLPISRVTEVLMGHGSGGKLTAQLIENLILPAFRNPTLELLDDQAVVSLNGSRLAFTTDSYVVTPIFFPGGDIGELAINGTVNDLAMSGARPLYLAAALILEEGLAIQDLQRVLDSMRKAAQRANVLLVTGDTKVVNRGKGDQIFITTTGIGVIEHAWNISADRARAGDKVLLSGSIGDHGMAIMSQREGLEFEGTIDSDTAALNGLVAAILAAAGDGVHVLRDPTRGGIATTLNEIAARSQVGMAIDESTILVRPAVQGACEILGLDPLYVANEGKLLAIVSSEAADAAVEAMHQHELGREARIIGEVVAEHPRMVLMKTGIGGTRIVDTLYGEQL